MGEEVTLSCTASDSFRGTIMYMFCTVVVLIHCAPALASTVEQRKESEQQPFKEEGKKQRGGSRYSVEGFQKDTSIPILLHMLSHCTVSLFSSCIQSAALEDASPTKRGSFFFAAETDKVCDGSGRDHRMTKQEKRGNAML
jgi:hypothetical protein